MTSRMPFSIHEYLRRSRHQHDHPVFPVFGNTKKYERMPHIALDEPIALDVSLTEAMNDRRSFPHDGGSDLKDLTTHHSSNLFGTALRARENGRRPILPAVAFIPQRRIIWGVSETIRRRTHTITTRRSTFFRISGRSRKARQ